MSIQYWIELHETRHINEDPIKIVTNYQLIYETV